MKSSGNRLILRFTCSLRRFVSTPYSMAKSLSSITCCPLTTFIKGSILLITTLLISHFVTSILDWSQIATGLLLSMLFAILLLFLRSQFVTLNVLLFIAVCKGSAFGLLTTITKYLSLKRIGGFCEKIVTFFGFWGRVLVGFEAVV